MLGASGAAMAQQATSTQASTQEKIEQYGPDTSLAVAEKVAAGAIKACSDNGWPMAIAVVDTHGTPVYYEKMDNTELGSAQAALEKAASSALYRRPTRAFYDVIAKQGPFMLTMPNVINAPGASPIFVDGKIVGALASSGGTGAQDEVCTNAGLATLK